MPFRSKAQRRYMFARHPETAKRWAKETPDMSKLPEKTASGMFFRDTPGRDNGEFHKEASRRARSQEKAAGVTPADWGLEEHLPSGRHRPASVQPEALEDGGERFHSEEARARNPQTKVSSDLRFMGTSFNKRAASMDFTPAEEYAGDTMDYLGDRADEAKRSLGRAGGQIMETADKGIRAAANNPLAAGIGALALGGLGVRGLRGAGRTVGRALGRKPAAPKGVVGSVKNLISGR